MDFTTIVVRLPTCHTTMAALHPLAAVRTERRTHALSGCSTLSPRPSGTTLGTVSVTSLACEYIFPQTVPRSWSTAIAAVATHPPLVPLDSCVGAPNPCVCLFLHSLAWQSGPHSRCAFRLLHWSPHSSCGSTSAAGVKVQVKDNPTPRRSVVRVDSVRAAGVRVRVRVPDRSTAGTVCPCFHRMPVHAFAQRRQRLWTTLGCLAPSQQANHRSWQASPPAAQTPRTAASFPRIVPIRGTEMFSTAPFGKALCWTGPTPRVPVAQMADGCTCRCHRGEGRVRAVWGVWRGARGRTSPVLIKSQTNRRHVGMSSMMSVTSLSALSRPLTCKLARQPMCKRGSGRGLPVPAPAVRRSSVRTARPTHAPPSAPRRPSRLPQHPDSCTLRVPAPRPDAACRFVCLQRSPAHMWPSLPLSASTPRYPKQTRAQDPTLAPNKTALWVSPLGGAQCQTFPAIRSRSRGLSVDFTRKRSRSLSGQGWVRVGQGLGLGLGLGFGYSVWGT